VTAAITAANGRGRREAPAVPTSRYAARVTSVRPRSTTARRIALAFGAVLLLFAAALVVIIVSLRQIAGAEREVARLDHAKHAGHMAAALARAQYIQQAHALLEWNEAQLPRYDEAAAQARAATDHLSHLVARPEATRIAALVGESDRRFRVEVLPAIAAGQRERIGALHALTQQPVDEVVALNEALNRSLEREADVAGHRAEGIRARVQLAVIACFALAIVLALAVGLYLMRSISRPVAALRAAAVKLGAGELSARVGLRGDDELAELAGAFDRMAADLERRQAELLDAHRLASIGQVASGVAHELNNPLGVMLGYLTLLRRDPELGEREELRIVEDEARQSKVIVAGLLDLARPVRLERGELDLGELARDAAARLAESGRSEGVSVRFPDNPPAVVLSADEGKVRQIVLNLLANALDAARDPAAAAAEVTVSWRRAGERAALHVDDRGPGVPAAVRVRLFEPFFTTRARGHGLGLAIARTLARAHGGDVELTERADGPGTRATLWLPVTAADAGRPAAGAGGAGGAGSAGGAGGAGDAGDAGEEAA
jgi:signal transduction histidine kinase